MAPRRRPRNVKIIFPSTITSFSMVLGFIAVLHATNNNVDRACLYVFLCMVLDALDGKVARMTNTASEFGIQYDSLADLVAFGVAPGVIFYRFFIFEQMPTQSFHFLLPIMYMVCGAIRLARFNITASIYGKTAFTGLPIPAAAFGIATLPLFYRWVEESAFLQETGLNRWLNVDTVTAIAFFYIVVASWSMISTVRFELFGGFLLRKYRPQWINYAVIVALLSLILVDFAVFGIVLAFYYLIATYSRFVLNVIRSNDEPKAPSDPDSVEEGS
jgi:CDP-diacylglycerol--serine O-phosphatidyltransferase